MTIERDAVRAAIESLERQRDVLGDDVVNLTVRPLRERLELIEATSTGANSSAPSDPAADDEPRLRQVTMLFVDTVGSTSMSSALDAEDVHELMNVLARRFTDVVERHHGRVMKYTGDGLLAAFGLSEAQEHAAAEAIRAGLAMHRETAIVAETSSIHVPDRALQIRVGVHSGEAVVGGGVEAKSSIYGQAVNLAARMEQSAPPGGLRISEETSQLVRGQFDLTEDDPILVKGVEQPLRTYLVAGERHAALHDAARGIDGLPSPMIGRAAELEALRRALGETQASRSFGQALIVADAGVGKSRLLREFTRSLTYDGTPAQVLTGRAQIGTRTQPFGLLRDLLDRWRRGEADEAAASTHLSHRLGQLIPLDEARHLSTLVGDGEADESLPREADQILALGQRAAASFLVALSEAGAPDEPIVMVLEDLHWADDATLDLIDHLRRVSRRIGVFVVATTRPEFLARPLGETFTSLSTTVELGPLHPQEARLLADSLLRRLDVVPRDLRDFVSASGGGVPFFMEEVLRSLIDRGSIEVAPDGAWSLDPHFSATTIAVPPTLIGILQTRFDALSRNGQDAAQRASVIGHVFWSDALAALGVGPDAVDELLDRGLIVIEEASSRPGYEEFRFRHHLLHQFVAQSVLKRDRKLHHQRAARWLIDVAGSERRLDHLIAIASHQQAGGERADAVSTYERAIESALTQGAGTAIADLATKALELVDDDAISTQWSLIHARAKVLSRGDERDRLSSDIDELHRLSDELDDDQRRASTLALRINALSEEGEYASAIVVATQLVELAERTHDDELLAVGLLEVSAANWRMGDLVQSQAALRRCASIPQTRLSAATRARVLRRSTQELLQMPRDFADAERWLNEALELSRSAGDRDSESTVLNSLGLAMRAIGRPYVAREQFVESTRLSRTIGSTFGEAIGEINVAELDYQFGDAEAAVERARSAADIAVISRSRDLEGAALLVVGYASIDLGLLHDAAAAFERARNLFVLNGSMHYALDGSAGLGLVELLQGNIDQALAHINHIPDFPQIFEVIDELDFGVAALAATGRILAAAGDARAADLCTSAASHVREALAALPSDQARDAALATNSGYRAVLDLTSDPDAAASAIRRADAVGRGLDSGR